jgi:hypothetical protein
VCFTSLNIFALLLSSLTTVVRFQKTRVTLRVFEASADVVFEKYSTELFLIVDIAMILARRNLLSFPHFRCEVPIRYHSSTILLSLNRDNVTAGRP